MIRQNSKERNRHVEKNEPKTQNPTNILMTYIIRDNGASCALYTMARVLPPEDGGD